MTKSEYVYWLRWGQDVARDAPNISPCSRVCNLVGAGLNNSPHREMHETIVNIVGLTNMDLQVSLLLNLIAVRGFGTHRDMGSL